MKLNRPEYEKVITSTIKNRPDKNCRVLILVSTDSICSNDKYFWWYIGEYCKEGEIFRIEENNKFKTLKDTSHTLKGWIELPDIKSEDYLEKIFEIEELKLKQ